MGTHPALLALQTRPLGMRWEQFSGISTYGAARRAWRVNQLKRSDLRAVLGLTVRAGDDLFEKSLTSTALAERLRVLYPALGEEMAAVASYWPFGGSVPLDAWAWALRECPACARSGYHSLLFQMPGIQRCPWHGQTLIDACPSCDRPLGEGLRHGLPPGQCLCGHDLVHEVDALTGGASVDRRPVVSAYLAWAGESRQRHWLVAPEQFDPNGWQALTQLLPPLPRALGQPRKPALQGHETVLCEDMAFHRFARHSMPRLGERSGLDCHRAPTAILPLSWFPPFRDIGRRLYREVMTAKGGPEAMENGELRPTLLGLPAYPCGKKMLLQVDCLDRTVRRSVNRLVSALHRPPGVSRFPVVEAFSNWLHSDPLGPALAEKLVQRLLLRGYAQGARIALGRHVPAMYASAKRPRNRYPWLVLRLRPDATPSARIAWTVQPGTL